MRVGAYVDGFNLYNGGLELAGTQHGWKWLDIRALAQTLAEEHWPGRGPVIERLVYCTTLIHPTIGNPDGPKKQKTFINALRAAGSVDHVEYGLFIPKVKVRPLAKKDRKGRPVLITSQAPVLVKNSADEPVRDAIFMVSVADREEKGSDVNVATHVLLDALAQPAVIEAAIVISNDSDLKLAVSQIRGRIPVGIVNPGRGYTAGALRHDPNVHVDGQWERQLTFSDYTNHQLAETVAGHARPNEW